MIHKEPAYTQIKEGDFVLLRMPYLNDAKVHRVTGTYRELIQTDRTKARVSTFLPREYFSKLHVCPNDLGYRIGFHVVSRAILEKTTHFICACKERWYYINETLEAYLST